MKSLYNVRVDGIDMRDSPDFVDAYISYAEYEDGTELTDTELDSIPQEIVYEYVIADLY